MGSARALFFVVVARLLGAAGPWSARACFNQHAINADAHTHTHTHDNTKLQQEQDEVYVQPAEAKAATAAAAAQEAAPQENKE